MRRLRSTAGFYAAAGAVVLILGAVLAALLWSPLIDLDRRVSETLVIPGHGTTVQVLEVLTAGASWMVRVPAAVLAAGWLLLTKRTSLAVFVATVSAGTPLIVELLKYVIDRPRPGWPDTAFVPGLSFPSGHSSGSAMMGGAAVVVLSATVGPRAARAAVPFAVAFALLIGYTRIALGAHFLSDVIGGWLLGVLIVVVTAWLCGVLPRQNVGSGTIDE